MQGGGEMTDDRMKEFLQWIGWALLFGALIAAALWFGMVDL
jgi:hypothetical protein